MRQERVREPITFEEAARWDPDDFSAELVRGELEPMTKNTWRHGELVSRIAYLLMRHLEDHPGWSVAVGDPGAMLARDPDTLRGPDVGLIRADRRPTGRGAAGWLEGAPDVAIEVAGDAQPTSRLAAKALEYLAAGAKLVWVVDPEVQNVMIFTPPNHVQVIGAAGELDGGEVLSGFRCSVASIFA